jgi:hypothetical protein
MREKKKLQERAGNGYTANLWNSDLTESWRMDFDQNCNQHLSKNWLFP